ncbi:MAG: Hint domain-containing protein, partial [Rhodobacterales bacterium]|nr:Hint domain-containing protein [Rhodobacterales bacterium]MDX5414274.1 Hint domain-containing protein [Rhodobacterales bacterium]
DLVDAGAGDDVVFGGAGNDTLAGADGQNTLYGGEGDDSLIGASTDIGAFTILDGGSGADTLDGTAGQWDIASYFDSDAAVAIDLTDGLAETGGAAQGDVLVGIEQVDGANLHNDTLTAGHSGMTLRGWGGNDTLIGGRGNDLLLGDAGSDTFRLSDSFGHDTIQGGTGYDTIDLSGLSRPVVVVFSGPGAGSITDTATGHTITFSDIEELILTPFADQVDAGPDNGHTYIQTRNGNDLLHGSAGDDVYDDEIFTPNGQGSDTFYGAAGNDVLWMGTDNDLAFGGDGSDRLEGQEGDDTLNGDAGDDLLSGGEGDDTLAGGTGNDALHGGADRDLFLLEDGFAADAISGGDDGDDLDVIDAGAMSQAVQVAFTGDEAGSVVSGANTAAFSGVEGFSLTDQADGLDATGSAAAVVAGGAGGNDTLVGGAGDDVLSGDGRYANLIQNGSFETTTGMTVTSWGYRGDTATAPGGWYTGAGGVIDIHHSGSGAPSDGANWLDMEAVAGIDTVSQAVQGVIAGQSYTLRFDAIDPVGDNAVNVFWNGTLIDTIAPGTGAHRTYSYDLVGGAGDGSNILTFQSLGPLDMTGVALDNVQFLGFSSLDAGAGNDSLNGGAGDDLLIGGAGNDTLVGGAGADTLIGGDGYDIIEYSDSGSAVFIDLSDDLPEQGGEAQGDVLSGFEMIGGSQQDDVIILGDTAMNVGANGGNDSVVGGAGNDRVWAGFGHDTVSGGGGDDLLSGQEGDDLLDGGLGADTLEGGAGADRLTGGAGNDLVVLGMDGAQDVIVFGDGDGSDTITGLDAPTDNGDGTFTGVDRLDVSHLTDAAGARVNTGDVTVTDDGAGNAVLGFPNGETLTLLGISPATADNPAWLAALGIPAPDFVVDGTASADLIDTTYTGDPEGDMVDAGDAADGSHDDVIDAGAGDDTVFAGDGNDTLDGGAGADTLDGGTGDDVISVGSGDAAAGGAGDDLFLVTPAMLDGGALFIDGGEDDETFGDTLNITGPASIVLDGSNPENGTVTWLDGTTLTFQNIENVAYTPCFTESTLIKTRRGEVPAAQLRIGDMVLTRNHGYQPIRWIGIRHLDRAELSANPALNPVVIRAGALGPHTPERDLTVSPQHRMLIGGGRAQLWFEEDEVFVPALHLTCVDGVAQIRPDSVTYVHILFDCHQIVSSDGAWSESYQPGDLTLAGMDEEQRAELFAIFPELFDGPPGQRYPAARITLKRHEVPLLFA